MVMSEIEGGKGKGKERERKKRGRKRRSIVPVKTKRCCKKNCGTFVFLTVK